jgi:gliding motility-associated-like protein
LAQISCLKEMASSVRLLLCLGFMLLVYAAGAQEICDNGVDDNGNGLVDLNDAACVCAGIGLEYDDVTGKIPNPNFEEMDCCPNFISQVGTCLSSWLAPSTGTPDYQNTCDFVMFAAYEANIHPFPSGNGVVGMIVGPSWKEYIGACLNSPLEAGQEYEFRIKIAFTPIFMSGNYPLAPNPPAYPPVFFSIYGNVSCNNMDMNGTNCPPNMNNNWSEIGSSIYTELSNQWSTLVIRFTPPVNMSGFIFGPACNVPQSYQTAPIIPYFWLDDMELYEVEETGSLETDLSGHPCTDDLELVAFGDPPGGDYQWYYNGVAIAGATSEVLYINQEDYEPGIYQVRYSFGNECAIDTLELYWELPQPSEENHTFCPGETVVCAGQTFSQPGAYEITLQTADGCDSLVTCILALYPESPLTELEEGICHSETVDICGQLFSASGEYDVLCQDVNGCDSLVTLRLQVMQPQAFVVDPGPMDCDTTVFSVLDGSFSNEHDDPEGSTTYRWTGPVNGIVGRDDLPVITVHYPGTYCLELIFESFGSTCSDIYCVELERPAVFPENPVLQGPASSCMNTPVQVSVPSGMYDESYNYLWFVPQGIQVTRQNDTTLVFTASDPGTRQICLATQNECGLSDTICHVVQIIAADTSRISLKTCDINQPGRDTLIWQNANGCDSILIRTFEWVEADSTFQTLYVCSPAEVRQDTLRLSSSSGCDSLVFRQFIPGFSDTTFLFDRRCDIDAPQTDIFTLQGLHCDSIVVIQRIPLPSDTLRLSLVVCDPAEAGQDTTFLFNQFGCDSLIVYTRTFSPPDTTRINLNTCDSTLAGTETVRLPNRFGCDSLIITTRTLADFTFSEQVVRQCGDGADFTDTLRFSGSECDSFVFVHYRFFPIDTTAIDRNTCDPSQAGFSQVTLTNQFGCDSILLIQTTLRASPPLLINDSSCRPELAGTFTDTLSNAFGCDSIIIRQVQFLPLDTTFLLNTSCDPQQAGTRLLQLSSALGCDSIVRIQTELLPSDTIRQDTVICLLAQPFSDSIRLVNQFGCDSLIIRLNRPEPIPLRIDLGPDQIVREGESVSLLPNILGEVTTFRWHPDSLFACPGCSSQTLFPERDVRVRLDVISPYGCIDSTSVFLRVIRDINIFIPDAFTPDLDGINDKFTVFGSSRLARILSLQVFDRWGNLLYNGQDLPPSDPRYGWDGSFKGQRMDPAVFAYLTRVLTSDGQTLTFSGEVQLLR